MSQRPYDIRRIHRSIDLAGLLDRTPVDRQEAAKARARKTCAVCEFQSTKSAGILEHNRRCSEFGERSYPCFRTAA